MNCTRTLRYIGLDVHKKWIQFCIVNRQGRIVREGRFEATADAIDRFARSLKPTDAVALEATGFTWALVCS